MSLPVAEVRCRHCKGQQSHMYGLAGMTDDKRPLFVYHCMNCGESSTRLAYDDRPYWSKQALYNFIAQQFQANTWIDEWYFDLACYYLDLYVPTLKDELKARIHQYA